MRIPARLFLSSVALGCGRNADLGGGDDGGGGGATPSSDATTPDGSSMSDVDAGPIALADLCPLFTEDLCIYLMQCSKAPYEDLSQCMAENTCYGVPDLTRAANQGAVL